MSRRALIALVGLGAALIVAVPAAWAIHDFTDVPNAHPFHAEIAAVKDAGITAGKTCVPPGTFPTYCPSEAITREAMAAFMHRGAGRIASEQVNFTASLPGPAGNTLVSDADVIVGGVSGEQLVHLQATFTASGTNAGCPCNFGIRLWEGGVGATELQVAFEQFTLSGYNQRTFTISDVVLATSGLHQYELSVAHTATSVTVSGLNFTATVLPFGGFGTNAVIGSLGGASPSTSPGSSSTTPTG